MLVGWLISIEIYNNDMNRIDCTYIYFHKLFYIFLNSSINIFITIAFTRWGEMFWV